GDVAHDTVQLVDRHADRAAGRAVAILAAMLGLVAAGAKSLLAGAGQHHDADILVPSRFQEGVEHLDHGPRAEGIVDLGPVDADGGDTIGFGMDDVLVDHGADLLSVIAGFNFRTVVRYF